MSADPPPPPTRCDRSTQEGQGLYPQGHLSGQELRISILNEPGVRWTEVSIYAVTGGTARPVSPGEPLTIVIDLANDSVTTGSFTLSGVLEGYAGGPCRVVRTFTFTIERSGVTVASVTLPLEHRQAARIALVRRDGREVELDVVSREPGDGDVHWSVSGGRVLSQDGTRLLWRLPDRTGLYHAELLVDHGRRGLSYDTLALAVEPVDRGSAT